MHSMVTQIRFGPGGVLSLIVETDEDPTQGSEATGEQEVWPEEDFSVYVAPKTMPLVPSDEPILRIEPTLALVSWPLAILVFLDIGFDYRIPWDQIQAALFIR